MARHIDLYQAFGLNRTAGSPELAQQLTGRLSHTDPADSGLREQIAVARTILADPQRRAAYDAHLADQAAPPITEHVLAAMAATPTARPPAAAGFSGQVPSQGAPHTTGAMSPQPVYRTSQQAPMPGLAARRGVGKKWLFAGAGGLVVLLVLVIGVVAAGGGGVGSNCADIVFIGAAGSGQRTETKVTQYDGMGEFVSTTYVNLLNDANDAGKSVEKRVVEYPAAPITTALSETFSTSVEAGAQTAKSMIGDVIGECGESTTIVAAGYSQGAMVMHRALHGTTQNGSIVGVLIADGDRIPTDPNVLFGGGAANLPGIAYSELGISASGVEQARFFPANWRDSLVSWCLAGDTVCANTPGKIDFDLGAGAYIHTKGYDPSAWRPWVKKRVLG